MTPRVRQYIADAAAAFGVDRDEITGKSGRRTSDRARAVAAARRAVWQRLIDHGFPQTQVARWFGRHPSTICVQVTPQRRAA